MYDKLTPAYDFGCQRTAFASDYYPVFTKANTSLITEKIDSVTTDSIITGDGSKYEIDVSAQVIKNSSASILMLEILILF